MEERTSLQGYLQQKGVTSQTPGDQVAELKKAYWKEKRKGYWEEEKTRDRRLNLTLTNREYRQVVKAAAELNKRPTTFAKQALLAYLEQRVLLPHQEQLLDLMAEINAIGTNINQVVHALHGMRAYTDQNQYMKLVKEVRAYQEQIKTYLSQPPDLYEALRADLTAHPENRMKVTLLLDELNAQTLADDHQK